jgi:hypothetical protein
MLRITGKTTEVTTEVVNVPGKPSFESTTIYVLTGKSKIEAVRVGRDFSGLLPKEDEPVELVVVVSAYATRTGAGYRLTALERVAAPAGARVAAA